jgi:hypothetical protein
MDLRPHPLAPTTGINKPLCSGIADTQIWHTQKAEEDVICGAYSLDKIISSSVVVRLFIGTQNRLVALHSALIKAHEETDLSPCSVIYRPIGSTMQLVTLIYYVKCLLPEKTMRPLSDWTYLITEFRFRLMEIESKTPTLGMMREMLP